MLRGGFSSSKAMNEVIKLFGKEGRLDQVASCPKCDGQGFYILLDGVGLKLDHIYAFECIDCENKIWVKITITEPDAGHPAP